jgi:hypothetical protein
LRVGHDKLCCHYSNRTHAKYLCRYCDTPIDKTDEPTHEYSFTKQNDIKELIEKRDVDGLKKLSYNLVTRCAFHAVLYGGDPRGIHGALLGEVLHVIQEGLFPRLKDGLFGERAEKTNSKKNKEQVTDNGEVLAQGRGDLELNRNKVFGDKLCNTINAAAKKIGFLLKHQSDRDLPRCYFTHGVTSNSRLQGHEQGGTLIVILLIFCMSLGEQLFEKAAKNLGPARCADYIGTIELALLLETLYTRSEPISRTDLELLRDFIPGILERFKKTVDRKAGMGMRFIKFHLPNHLVEDILRFGFGPNFSTCAGESHHLRPPDGQEAGARSCT